MTDPRPRSANWLLTQAKKAIARGASPDDVLAFIQVESGEKILSFEALKSAAEQEDQVKIGKGEGVARAFTQGLTLGFADEIAGVADKLFGGDYTQARDAERGAQKSFAKENPKTAFAAEFAGGILPALAAPGVRVAKGAFYTPQIAGMMGQGAKVGGTFGLLAGTGHSEADSPLGVAGDAAAGTALGAGLGAATPPAAALVGLVGAAAGGLGRDILAPEAGVASRANNRLNRMWDDSKWGSNPSGALQRAGELEAYAGADAMAADLSPRIADELRAGLNLGGAARDEFSERLLKRGENQLSRIEPSLENSVGVGRVNTRVVQRLAKTINRVENGQAYQALQDQNPVVADADILNLLDGVFGSAGSDLWSSAQAIAKASGRKLPDQFIMSGSASKAAKAPDFNSVFYIKKALDGKIDAGFKAGGADAQVAAGLKPLRDRLDDRMREVIPDYDAVQHEYWLAKQMERAIEEGRKIARSNNVTDARIAMSDLVNAAEVRTPAERNAIREAIRSAHLDETITQLRQKGEGAVDPARFFTRAGKEREEIMGMMWNSPQEFQTFLGKMENLEQAMNRTGKIATQNSSTAKQLIDASEASGQLTQGTISGGKGGAVAVGGNLLARTLFGDLNRQAGARTAQQLMRPDVTNVVQERVAALAKARAREVMMKRVMSGILPALVSEQAVPAILR